MLNNKPKIFIGMGSCGLAAGAKPVYDVLKRTIDEEGLDVDIKPTGCIGMCSQEVLVDIVLPGRTRVSYGGVQPENVPRLLSEHIRNGQMVSDMALVQMKADGVEPYKDLPFLEDTGFFASQNKVVLKNCGYIEPEKIEEYEDRGGYQALREVLKELSPEDVIKIVSDSGLRGRGGAGFPTGLKWSFCRASKNWPKYIIVNADEGDPGAFMDRSVMEGDPHAVLEGLTIGAYAIGCQHGFIYCRAEYPLAVRRFGIAIEQARQKGFLGKNILGTDFSFDCEVREGAGAFVCGEETALMGSIEGRRGMPSPRPPFPAHKGLWGQPSNINNVETFANVPQIINRGSEWYSAIGSAKSKGTKVFALTGKIKNSGLVEVAMGLTLRDLVEKVGGGIPKRKKFKAAQLGGPSGGCIPARLLDTPIDYDSLIQAGAIMGSGGVVIMDQNTCMVDMARFFLAFTQEESCGKCVPCRIGTHTMLQILTRITKGEGKEGDVETLMELADDIKGSSLCGLGQTAPNPVLSTIRYFREEYDAHIREKRCPAVSCKALIKFAVVEEKCTMCGLCKRVCPVGAVQWEKKTKAQIISDKCTKCQSCIDVCSFFAIE